MAKREKKLKRLSAYHAIMIAAKRGTGCRLTAGEVWQLSKDESIEIVVDLWDDDEQDRKDTLDAAK